MRHKLLRVRGRGSGIGGLDFQLLPPDPWNKRNPCTSEMRVEDSSGIATTLSALTVLVFVLMVWGGIVRNSGAGLACPDWPLCHGQFIPPLEGPILLEYFHRLLAAAVGFLTLGCAILIWRHPVLRSWLGAWAFFAVLTLAAQVVLGGLAVKGLLNPVLVAGHLTLGLAFFTVILWMALRAHEVKAERHGSKGTKAQGVISPPVLVSSPSPLSRSSWLGAISWGTTVLVYLQATIGGLVSASHAGLACPDLPTCNGMWLPPLEGPVALHMAHRIGAVIVTLAVIGLTSSAGLVSLNERQRLFLRGTLSLVMVQILLGIGNVLLELPMWIDVAHLGTAIALCAMLFMTTYEIAYH